MPTEPLKATRRRPLAQRFLAQASGPQACLILAEMVKPKKTIFARGELFIVFAL